MVNNEIKYIYIFGNLYVSVKGAGVSTNCMEFKNEVCKIIDDELDIHNVYIYLKECTYMDSTFMGILVGIRNRAVEDNEGEFYVVKPSEPVWDLLCEMGISLLVKKLEEDVPFPEDKEMMISKNNTDKTEDILWTHQNLANINDENKNKFALLLEILNNMKQ